LAPSPITQHEPGPSAHPRSHPAQRPWLDVDGDHYPLLAAITILGRDNTADIILDDPGISRQHTEIRVTSDGPHLVTNIRDLGSTNGTFVNGERITSQRLADGDRVNVGRTVLIFRAERR
jgi:pSer/pThr/pTyr-binding forkhead associated (FHA) protein